jgi:hypothetical protein
MYRDGNPFPRPHEQQSFGQRSGSSGMDGRTRLLIVGGVVAVVTWFAWPYVRGEMGEVGRQLSGDNRRTGFPPVWDPLGLMPGQGDTAAAPDRRLRLPPGVGNAEANPYSDRRDRYQLPDRDPERPAPTGRRWKECRPDGSGRLQCGPWQDGPAPGYGRAR